MDERQVHVVEIKAPIAEVWAEITKLKQVQKPMFNTVLEAHFKPGSRMIYRSEDGKRVFILGEVKEFVPPSRFCIRFDSPTSLNANARRVESRRDERRHARHRDAFEIRRPAEDRRLGAHGWVDILGNIKAVVETGNVPLKTRIVHGMMSAFMFMAPKETLRENIPELRE